MSYSMCNFKYIEDDILFFIQNVDNFENLKELLPSYLNPNDLKKIEIKEDMVYFWYNKDSEMNIKIRNLLIHSME